MHNQLSSPFWYAMIETSMSDDMLNAFPSDCDAMYMAGGEL